MEHLRVQAVVDEQVCPGAEQDGRQRDERDERDGQPGPDPAHHGIGLSGRPCSPRRGRSGSAAASAGSASILARRRWIATSTRRESPR